MTKNEIILDIYLQPNAKKSALSGEHGGLIKIKVNSPPVDGKANEELILFLSKFLKIPKSFIKIISGETSRIKKISIVSTFDKADMINKLKQPARKKVK